MNYNYKKVNKPCKQCGKEMIEVDSSRLFCDKCNKIKYIQAQHKRDEKVKQKRLENKEQKLNDNFLKYNDNIENYIMYNFNKISNISTKAYTKYFNLNWINVLKHYEVFDKFYKMLKIKFIDFQNKNNIDSTRIFCRENHLTDLEIGISMQQFREDCGLNKNKYNDNDLKENILNLKNQLGRFPLFNEFRELSSISMEAYKCHLKKSHAFS